MNPARSIFLFFTVPIIVVFYHLAGEQLPLFIHLPEYGVIVFAMTNQIILQHLVDALALLFIPWKWVNPFTQGIIFEVLLGLNEVCRQYQRGQFRQRFVRLCWLRMVFLTSIDRHSVFGTEVANSIWECHISIVHQEVNRSTVFPATEAVIHVAFRWNLEAAHFPVCVEWAKALIIDTAFADVWNKIPHYIQYACRILNSPYVQLVNLHSPIRLIFFFGSFFFCKISKPQSKASW